MVERGGLENRCTFASTQGSIPVSPPDVLTDHSLFPDCCQNPAGVAGFVVKTQERRFETLCGLSPKSLLCSPIFSKPPNPAVSGSELLGQYLWALRGLFSE